MKAGKGAYVCKQMAPEGEKGARGRGKDTPRVHTTGAHHGCTTGAYHGCTTGAEPPLSCLALSNLLWDLERGFGARVLEVNDLPRGVVDAHKQVVAQRPRARSASAPPEQHRHDVVGWTEGEIRGSSSVMHGHRATPSARNKQQGVEKASGEQRKGVRPATRGGFGG